MHGFRAKCTGAFTSGPWTCPCDACESRLLPVVHRTIPATPMRLTRWRGGVGGGHSRGKTRLEQYERRLVGDLQRAREIEHKPARGPLAVAEHRDTAGSPSVVENAPLEAIGRQILPREIGALVPAPRQIDFQAIFVD